MKIRIVCALLICGLLGAAAAAAAAVENDGWFDFNPPPDPFAASAIDLRGLNEKFAGEHGRIAARGEEFIHSANQQPVRFWAVNGPPGNLNGDALTQCARRLAKYGVNLARMHSAIFNKAGDADMQKVAGMQQAVTALKAEGIYSHFSIYFPLWMSPPTNHAWLKGYNGHQHPFAALMFNPEFQEQYRSWWKALLLTPDRNGRKLVDEPAVFGVEIQNEDSFFFWTFNPDQIPAAQMEILETQFGAWLKNKYGSLDAAQMKWGGTKVKRDDFSSGRAGFRLLWNIFNEKTPRDRDTVRFLFETQRNFYVDTVKFLRDLGFKGLITPSNWATASPEIFGPLERWSYATGDFIDRHGYFSVAHKGDNAEWSIRDGHTYTDRSALRFDSSAAGKPKQFVHPAMEITYAGKPQMISETTWNRPNRYRSEAPLYFAGFGALQDTDAIVHFALDSANWAVKPGFWMQPWTLMTPSQMGQFPAAALIFRRRLVKSADLLANIDLNTDDLLDLKGTPLPQDASFDELRLKDVPVGTETKPGQRIDPLIHYAGRVAVNFTATPSRTTLSDLKPWLDRAAQTVRSSTGELALNYGTGLLTINALGAQGLSGNLGVAGRVTLKDLTIDSPLDNVHIIVIALDGEPIAKSKRMLLQAMSEEQATGYATEDAGNGVKKITNIGKDPWRVKNLQGSVRFHSANGFAVQPLDFNGYPKGAATQVDEFKLAPDTVYYLVTRTS